MLIDHSDRYLGLLIVLKIWRDRFIGVSLAFVVIHDDTEAGARWFFWSKDVGPDVVDRSFFPNFVDGRRRILVLDNTGTSPGRHATTTCASLLALGHRHTYSPIAAIPRDFGGGQGVVRAPFHLDP
jgi:hypothetical protein